LIHAMECEDVLGGIDGNALKFHGTVLGWWFDNPTLALDAVGPSTSTTAVTFDVPAVQCGRGRRVFPRPSWPCVSRPSIPSRWGRCGRGTPTSARVAGTRPAMTERGMTEREFGSSRRHRKGQRLSRLLRWTAPRHRVPKLGCQTTNRGPSR